MKIFDHNPRMPVSDEYPLSECSGNMEASIRQAMNYYFVRHYGVHSCSANLMVEAYLNKIAEDIQ